MGNTTPTSKPAFQPHHKLYLPQDASAEEKQSILRLMYVRSVEYPADSVSALESNEHVHVERDAEVKTQ